MYYKRLRTANVDRQAEWPGGEHVDPDFRGNELAGEAGELLNLIKKVTRLEKAISGTTETEGQLRSAILDEVGDAMVCLDLVGMEMGVEIGEQEIGEKPAPYPTLGKTANAFMGRVGYICDILASINMDPNHEYGPEEQEMVRRFVRNALRSATTILWRMSDQMGIDMWDAVEMKFNKTSEKHGLKTRF